MAVRQLKENIGKNFAYFFYILFFAVFLVVSSTTNCLSKWDAGVLVDFVGIKSEFKTKDNLSYMNYKLKKMLAVTGLAGGLSF